MVSIEKRISETFSKDIEPSQDVCDRIANRVMASKCACDIKVPDPARRYFKRPAKAILGAGLVVILIAIFLLSGKSHPSLKTATFDAQKALAAIQKPGMITYYRIVGSTKDDDPDKRLSWQAEYWVDYDKQMLKSVHHSDHQKGDFTTILLIRDGKAINMEMSNGEAQEIQESDAPKPFDDPIMNGVRQYRELLKSGKAEILGEEKIRGITTYKIKITLVKSPAKDGITDLEIANIQKDDYKPVKIAYEAWQTQQGKEKKLISETTSFFEETRLIDPKDLGKEVFTIDIPKGINYQISHSFSIDQARQFKDFDLYYLGKSFDGFEFDGYIQYSKESDPNRPKGLPDSRAEMYYHDSRNEHGVFVNIWPIMEPGVRNSILIGQGERTNVTINGNPAVLSVFKGRSAYNICSLYVNIGRSTVCISCSNKNETVAKDRVIRAVKSLIKIN